VTPSAPDAIAFSTLTDGLKRGSPFEVVDETWRVQHRHGLGDS
jgi:hypothetical protein